MIEDALVEFLRDCVTPCPGLVDALTLRTAYLGWAGESAARPGAQAFLKALVRVGCDVEFAGGAWWIHGVAFSANGELYLAWGLGTERLPEAARDVR